MLVREFDQALIGTDYREAGPVRIATEGSHIARVESLATAPGTARFAMPALANAHDHARPLSGSAFGIQGQPLELWLPQLTSMPSVDAYTAAAASLARAAEGGCGSVMVHCVRLQGLKPVTEEVCDVARAARDVGVRIAFAVGLRDRNPLVYGDGREVTRGLDSRARSIVEHYFRVPEASAAEQIAMVEEIARAASTYGADIQYGPTGVQWCSDELLGGIADAAARHDRRVHMHLLETRHQRDYADAAYPNGVVEHLAGLGLLSHRLTLAHCVWAREPELARIAEADATIAVNTSSNLHLRSGRAPVGTMLRTGCRVALGVDGCALDDDDDAVRELRLASLVHAEPGIDGDLDRGTLLRAATRYGRRSVGAPGSGVLIEGEPADWLSLDTEALNPEALQALEPWPLVLARGQRRHIDELVVAGRPVVQGGRLVTLDREALHADLQERFRRAAGERADFRQTWPRIAPAIAAFYRERAGCC